jgi:hypothetical protein
MAILEKIAGWRHIHRETETVILITNNQYNNGVFYVKKIGDFERLRGIFE